MPVNAQISVNPHRPYYTPGLHHQYNYTSLPSSDTIPGLTPDVFDNEEAALKGMTTRFTSFAMLKYFVTMLTSPFEVGTTLLQVQYSPHEDVEVIAFSDEKISGTQESPSYLNGISSDEEDDGDAFYSTQPPQKTPSPRSSRFKSPSDSGLLARSVYDEETRPAYQMAPMNGGVLEILSHIIKQPTEGWKSLLKGQRVTWIYEMLRVFLQPSLERSLNDLFGLYDDTIPLMHLDNVTPNMTTLVASHLAVGILLSPLEIIRTRLIVQSSSPLSCKYKGIMHALLTMCREEGGLRSVYLSYNLIPTILYHIITPLISSSTPLIIDRVLHISASDSPISYGAAELAFSTLGLIITLPLETIRRRLHCQVNMSSAVALRPVPYKGVLDALYKIMKEEGTKNKKSTQPATRLKKNSALYDNSSDSDDDLPIVSQPKSTSAWGIRGLYKGFGMQMAANVMLFIFHTINGIEGGGAAGTSAAFWLHNTLPDTEITIYDDQPLLGGRSRVVPIKDNASLGWIEQGASIFVEANYNLMNATERFGLKRVRMVDSFLKRGLGVWDGQQFLFEESGWGWWDTVKALWRYGLAPVRFKRLLQATLTNFFTVYEPDSTFYGIPDVIEQLGLSALINSSARDYLSQQGIGERFVLEIIQTATRANYGQDVDVLHAFGALVSMAADGAWSVQDGNYQMFESFAKQSGAFLHLGTVVEEVRNVTKADAEGRLETRYEVDADDGTQGVYDVVIVASPLRAGSSPRMPFPVTKHYREYHTVHVALIAGFPNPAYFGRTADTMPSAIITTGSPLVLDTGESVVKMFSSRRLSDDLLDAMFHNRSWTVQKPWRAFPKLHPTFTDKEWPDLILDGLAEQETGIIYLNAFENFISVRLRFACKGLGLMVTLDDGDADYRKQKRSQDSAQALVWAKWKSFYNMCPI
ncbi:hypothetical protein DFQ28_010354 [Apophysomyces sp. BC1034]|nr:hypothetical protein DFQ28_010354 [Apophysomyces sp. BC1034]